jgi:acyl-CoA synthetase (AMP-forming)/AMP-acid ligase II
MNIASRLELITETHPTKPAFILFSPHNKRWDTVTFKQLSDTTHRLIRGLQACCAETGMRAVLMTPPSTDFFALAFALLKLGIVPIIVDPAIGLKNVTACLKESEPDIFIGNTITHFLRRIYGWGKATVKINTSIPSLLRITHDELHNTLHLPQLSPSSAAIIYTKSWPAYA